ncbi:sugar transport protein 2-like [Durio zibethinus]|uniref:Sugar transport protein 2-like n=1 Tax=Durio zibethinus TaxID=66656 RepID=A0A6P5XWP4_DURZI|nr:sugar transport protein 2-like [Durio zibethinus]
MPDAAFADSFHGGGGHLSSKITGKVALCTSIASFGGFFSRVTWKVFLCSVIASLGGLLFGYDIGISGGVTSMDDFLMKFFPRVYSKKHQAKENNYCKFNDAYLQLFTSSLYLAAIAASFVASFFSRKCGRKLTITLSSVFFLIGAIVNFSAKNLGVLIVGRIFLGWGLGFGNQTIPLFISEIAPAEYRGGLNILFQLLITVGILVANLINYWNSDWRYSLGGAAVPALLLLVCSFIIVDSPSSLIERGKKEEGLNTLKKIRGVDDVEREFEEIVQATEVANRVKHPYLELLMNRNNWPPLFSSVAIHIFQQFTGMNVIMFYAPVLFQTMGFGGKAALLSAAITGVVNCLSTVVSIFSVDKVGRRWLLVAGALTMLLGQCVVGGILHVKLKSTNAVSHGISIVVVIFICLFVSAFAWSWGPLGWLVASETFPLETRNAGYFCAVAINMLCTFIIAQTFLTMLCSMHSSLFFFFAAWLLAMTVSVYTMLPETKGILIDEMAEKAWKQHWFWKRFYHKATGNFEQMEAKYAQTKEVELEKNSQSPVA